MWKEEDKEGEKHMRYNNVLEKTERNQRQSHEGF
jgi:hypothetical protein